MIAIKNILAFLTEYKTKKAKLDSLQKEVDEMKTQLIEYTTGKASRDEKGKITFTCGQYTVTITECTREDIDKKRLEQEKPDIAKEYSKRTTYDRLTVK